MTWRDEAACLGADTDTFFDHNRVDEALSICETCPVIRECRDYATTRPGAINDIQGVWGGKTERQIQRVRAGTIRRPNPRLTLKPCGTHAAYKRHLKNGTVPCDACREANRIVALKAKRRQRQRERNTA